MRDRMTAALLPDMPSISNSVSKLQSIRKYSRSQFLRVVPPVPCCVDRKRELRRDNTKTNQTWYSTPQEIIVLVIASKPKNIKCSECKHESHVTCNYLLWRTCWYPRKVSIIKSKIQVSNSIIKSYFVLLLITNSSRYLENEESNRAFIVQPECGYGFWWGRW